MAHLHGGYLSRPQPSGLADVLEIVLDKGIVIDAYARVSVLGIELLTVDARIVVASVDTYLRFAAATNGLELDDKATDLVEWVTEGISSGMEHAATSVAESKVEDALDKVEGVLGSPGKEATRKVAGKVLDVAGGIGD